MAAVEATGAGGLRAAATRLAGLRVTELDLASGDKSDNDGQDSSELHFVWLKIGVLEYELESAEQSIEAVEDAGEDNLLASIRRGHVAHFIFFEGCLSALASSKPPTRPSAVSLKFKSVSPCYAVSLL